MTNINRNDNTRMELDDRQIRDLEDFATQIRLSSMREFRELGFGHIGGAFSVIETFSVLYGKVMKYKSFDPNWEQRDKLVCSKGHAGPSLYATLALKGFFPLEWLDTLNKPGTNLPSHCDRNKTPGIDMTTGSLGQGMSSAIGIALADKIKNRQSNTFLIIGDGELNEGQIWEGAQFASHYKLDNLIAFCDWNKKQLDGYVSEVINPLDIVKKFESFGWNSCLIDGKDIKSIYNAIMDAKQVKNKPHMIVLDTIKGAGFKAIEDMESNHHVVISKELADEAICHFEHCLTNRDEDGK